MIRHFTGADVRHKFRTGRNVLGAAAQLCALPWLGYVPDDASSAPRATVSRLSQRLSVPMGELRDYGPRSQTQTDHCERSPRTRVAQPTPPSGRNWTMSLRSGDGARLLGLLSRLACELLISGRVARGRAGNVFPRGTPMSGLPRPAEPASRWCAPGGCAVPPDSAPRASCCFGGLLPAVCLWNGHLNKP